MSYLAFSVIKFIPSHKRSKSGFCFAILLVFFERTGLRVHEEISNQVLRGRSGSLMSVGRYVSREWWRARTGELERSASEGRWPLVLFRSDGWGPGSVSGSVSRPFNGVNRQCVTSTNARPTRSNGPASYANAHDQHGWPKILVPLPICCKVISSQSGLSGMGNEYWSTD